jgi:predicted nucleotidyltransferase component of viral defense system
MLYKETVKPGTLGLLKELMHIKELEQFRLVGGTALSLLLGHRESIDLDLFTDEPFDRELIINKLTDTFPLLSFEGIKSPRLFFTYINDVKVDFVNTFEKFSYDYNVIEGIRFAATEEIIALKLNVIAGRGAKKDFWDLYELLNHYSFDQMISFYQKKYPNNALVMIAKSITYFAEADLQPDPSCFKNLKWEGVKKDIIKKFNIYIQNKI